MAEETNLNTRVRNYLEGYVDSAIEDVLIELGISDATYNNVCDTSIEQHKELIMNGLDDSISKIHDFENAEPFELANTMYVRNILNFELDSIRSEFETSLPYAVFNKLKDDIHRKQDIAYIRNHFEQISKNYDYNVAYIQNNIGARQYMLVAFPERSSDKTFELSDGEIADRCSHDIIRFLNDSLLLTQSEFDELSPIPIEKYISNTIANATEKAHEYPQNALIFTDVEIEYTVDILIKNTVHFILIKVAHKLVAEIQNMQTLFYVGAHFGQRNVEYVNEVDYVTNRIDVDTYLPIAFPELEDLGLDNQDFNFDDMHELIHQKLGTFEVATVFNPDMNTFDSFLNSIQPFSDVSDAIEEFVEPHVDELIDNEEQFFEEYLSDNNEDYANLSLNQARVKYLQEEPNCATYLQYLKQTMNLNDIIALFDFDDVFNNDNDIIDYYIDAM